MTEEDQQSGNILFWGTTDGNENPLMSPHQFSSIVALDICNGSRFTAILADDGFCYTTGDSSWYGGNEPNDDIKCWEELRDLKKIVCGQNYMAGLTTLGTVYTWGHNTHGQLGIEDSVVSKFPGGIVSVPTMITNLHKVVDIASGGEFMAALTRMEL
jgi:alpha-tubulin suppressor-like RCC1 family protein